jgi:hypothetical protein
MTLLVSSTRILYCFIQHAWCFCMLADLSLVCRLFNYCKSPKRGVKDFGIELDHKVVYMGRLQRCDKCVTVCHVITLMSPHCFLVAHQFFHMRYIVQSEKPINRVFGCWIYISVPLFLLLTLHNNLHDRASWVHVHMCMHAMNAVALFAMNSCCFYMVYFMMSSSCYSNNQECLREGQSVVFSAEPSLIKREKHKVQITWLSF